MGIKKDKEKEEVEGEDERERGRGEKAFYGAWCHVFYTSYPSLQMLKLRFKAIGGPAFVPSLTAPGLDSGAQIPALLLGENTNR